MPVRKVKGGFKVVGVKTVHKTREDAERQLRAIKASQARRRKGRR